jgi:hypothetical protein
MERPKAEPEHISTVVKRVIDDLSKREKEKISPDE